MKPLFRSMSRISPPSCADCVKAGRHPVALLLLTTSFLAQISDRACLGNTVRSESRLSHPWPLGPHRPWHGTLSSSARVPCALSLSIAVRFIRIWVCQHSEGDIRSPFFFIRRALAPTSPAPLSPARMPASKPPHARAAHSVFPESPQPESCPLRSNW